MPSNGLSRENAASGCGWSQRQAAAEDAAAAAQPHRHEIVVGGGEPRAGKAHQHAAVLDPARQPVARLARDIADIGEDHHRQVLVEELRSPLRAGEPRSASRTSANGLSARDEIVGRGEQRLRGVGGRAGDDADRAAAPALVEQLHGAGGALAGDLEPGDVVADFDRQVELAPRSRARPPLKANGASPSGRPFEIERAHDAGFGRAARPARSTFTVSAPAALSAAASACAPATPPSTTVIGRCRRACRAPSTNSRAAAEIDAVGEPHAIRHRGVAARKRVSARQRFGALDRMRLRLDLLQPHARRAGVSSEMSRPAPRAG